jgi:putative peptidoglycan lipid II flippase
LLAPSVGAFVLSACVNGWLTIERRFVLLNGVQILYSVGAIGLLATVSLADVEIEAEAVVAGWSVGNLAALGVLLSLARPRRSARPSSDAAALLKIGAPLAIASGLLVAQSVTDRAVAARLDTGDVAALGYADRLFLLPIGFVLAVVGPIVLGSLTLAAASGSARTLGAMALRHCRFVLRIGIPVNLAFAALAPLAIPLIFQYGAFSDTSTDRTTEALDGLVIGLAATSMFLVLVRVLQAADRRRTLIRLAAAAALANLAMSVAGGLLLGLMGVTLATSATAAFAVLAGIESLGGHLGPQWRQQGRRLVTLPVLAVTIGLGLLLTAEHTGLLSRDIRLAMIGCAAVGLGTRLAGRKDSSISNAKGVE